MKAAICQHIGAEAFFHILLGDKQNFPLCLNQRHDQNMLDKVFFLLKRYNNMTPSLEFIYIVYSTLCFTCLTSAALKKPLPMQATV